MSDIAVSINNVTKTYRTQKGSPEMHALKGVSLDIKKGSFFGLLGPNGAGKSTLINIMAGLVVKSSGNISISGRDIDTDMRGARMALGVVPQELVLDTFFTVREALDIHAGYYGIPKAARRTDELIEAMGLTEKADRHARGLSGGMRRRLLIAKALVHRPDVLILDEPTAGVDVELRTQLWAYVRELNAQGTTILLTTHYLEEAEELCDEIAIITRGNIVAHDSKAALMKTLDNKCLCVKIVEPLGDQTPEALASYGWKLESDNSLSMQYSPSNCNVEALFAQIKGAGYSIADISTTEANLEDVFLHLTQDNQAA